jgi:hypothetical protein
MPIESLPIFAYYNKQRFTQFGCMDCANWYGISAPDTKNMQALYPAMGRKHVVNSFGENKLVYTKEPKAIFKTINYLYVILDTQVIQVDRFYNEIVIGNVPLGSIVWFAFLPVGNVVYAMLTAQTIIYVITENANGTVTMQAVTDLNAPKKPLYVASFGNRFVVSNQDTPDYFLTDINLGGVFNPATAFTINGAPLFNRASGVIGQFAVLHNQLYIFNDFTTDIWSNIPSQLIDAAGNSFEFPWKLSSSYNWDYGIADPDSLAVDFGRMVFLAKNSSGLVSFMASNGQQPQDISSQAINVLLENSTQDEGLSPFVTGTAEGFIYQYENTIFYRVTAGPYLDLGDLDRTESANAIEYNFSTKTWARVIELNGERNRIQKHVYFTNKHLVTVAGDGALYEMAGNIYRNELRTPGTNPQDVNAFTKFPMRYTLTTQQIFEPDYSEFITDYVEIDFVFGFKDFYKFNAPFDNTIFIIKEEAAPDGTPIFQIAEDQELGEDVFLIMEEGNTPSFDDSIYYALFKPHVELYYSNDGGVTFLSADLREFSQLGQYRWRMRWFELGTSRNRSYKLVCVSSAPIVILGAVQNKRRASGGAN